MEERPIYSSPNEVIRYTSIQPKDLDLDTPEKLNALINQWLVQAKDLIDQDRNRDYHKEVELGKRSSVPSGIDNIALRIVANMVAQAKIRRDTSIVRVDDYEIKMADDEIFTKAIRSDLSLYPKKRRFSFLRISGRSDRGEE